MPRAARFIVIVVLLAACERPGENPEQTRHRAGQALSGTLAYPRSSMVSVSAGEEAAQLVMSSPDSVTTVATWFLQALTIEERRVGKECRDRRGEYD